MKRIILIFLAMLSVFNIYADSGEVTELDFDACYKLAEQRNFDYIKAKYELEAAGADLQKATGMFGPTISVMGGYQPIYKANILEIPAGIFGPEPMSFPMGSQTYYSMRLSFTQPVFTFGKNISGLKMAESGYKIAKIKFKKAEEKLKLDVISAFYGALITAELYQITKESLKRTEETLDIIKEKYKTGEVSKLDLLMAEVELANEKPKLKETENKRNIALDGLKLTLGMNLEEKIELKGKPGYEKFEMTYKETKEMLENKNDDREMLQAAANISRYKKNLSLAMLLPNIAVSGNLNYISYEKDLSTSKSDWDSSWDISIGFQWEFFNSFRNVADIKKAAAEEQVQQINLQNAERGLKIKLKELFSGIEENIEILEAADKNIRRAEESYKMAKDSYLNGLINRTDLVGAELGLMQAKMQRLNALYNYTIKLQEINNFIR